MKYTVPVPPQGRVSEVGNALTTSYRLKTGVVVTEPLGVTGGSTLKKTPTSLSLPVKPSEPTVRGGREELLHGQGLTRHGVAGFSGSYRAETSHADRYWTCRVPSCPLMTPVNSDLARL